MKLLTETELPRELSRDGIYLLVNQAAVAELRQPVPFALEIAKILESSEIQKSIDQGKVTLALIKPELELGVDPRALNGEGLSDPEIAERFIAIIEKSHQIILSFSLLLTEEMISTWYDNEASDAKQRQLHVPPIKKNRYARELANRWDEFVSLLTGGPTTFLLLYSDDGQAVQHWRELMGSDWNVERAKAQGSQSLRARFGIDNHNNLFHGSDSIKSVKMEVGFMIQFLRTVASGNYS